MSREISFISNKIVKTVSICASLFILLGISGCSGGDGEAANSKAVPKIIQDVDDVLSKPFDEHFKNIQGDYSVAYGISGKIQRVINEADSMSTRHIMGLVQLAGDLEKNQSEDNYSDLVIEWNSVRTKIKLRKN